MNSELALMDPEASQMAGLSIGPTLRRHQQIDGWHSCTDLFRFPVPTLEAPDLDLSADVARFFMTIPEVAQLAIEAGAMGQGGDVFVLDMGQPVKIIDLARRMVEL